MCIPVKQLTNRALTAIFKFGVNYKSACFSHSVRSKGQLKQDQKPLGTLNCGKLTFSSSNTVICPLTHSLSNSISIPWALTITEYLTSSLGSLFLYTVPYFLFCTHSNTLCSCLCSNTCHTVVQLQSVQLLGCYLLDDCYSFSFISYPILFYRAWTNNQLSVLFCFCLEDRHAVKQEI
jgi:hypothetical protein